MAEKLSLLLTPDPPAKWDQRWMREVLSGIMGRIEERGVPDPPSEGYTVKNYTPIRTLDASTATATDCANVLCTLIDDLRQMKVIR